ncbi:MAG: GNAT family N-acetyltransferase [Chloroflexota bacterium]
MTTTAIITFTVDHMHHAAQMLTARHQRDRGQQPLSPAQFDAEAALQTALEKPRSQGIAAFNGENILGYLLDYRLHTPTFGRTAWLGLSGYALAEDASIELYRDMYAVLAEKWVCDGYFDHFVMVPAARHDLLDLWFSLGFGMQQGYALLDLRTWKNTAPVPVDVTVRLATPDDADAVRAMADTIAQYQMQSPVFAPVPPEVIREDIRPGMVDLIEDPAWTLWLAEKDSQIVGYQGYAVNEYDPTSPMIPENCIELSISGTVATARGSGVGRALTAHGLRHAQIAGYDYCLTDWRTTNLSSSRFWPRFGFAPVAYRLTRHIDPRIMWTTRFKCSYT